MRRACVSRDRADLFARPPSGARESERDWFALIVDPVAQLKELAELRRRGVLSPEEFELQNAKVLAPPL